MLVPVLAAALCLLGAPIDDSDVQADGGMPIGRGTTAPTITLTAPVGGWTVDRMLHVAGTVSDPTVNPVVLSINGDRYLLATRDGRFSRKFPAASGKNVVTAMATNRGGTGRASASSYAQVPPVPFKVVLTSDTDGVYTDLHIYEPTPQSVVDGKLDKEAMAHVYWAETSSPSGGTFFLNEQDGDFDKPGYGPYLYVHRAPPRGLFLIAANYWPSGDKAHTLATLNLTMFEGTPQEIKRAVRIPLATAGTTRVLAWVLVVEKGAIIYSPLSDREPRGAGWPVNLAAVEKAVNSEKSSDE